jgi:hypothetical protein
MTKETRAEAPERCDCLKPQHTMRALNMSVS